MTFHSPADPVSILEEQPSLAQQSLELAPGLTAHQRRDLPGAIHHSAGFSHHLLTFFLSENERQTVYHGPRKLFDGPMATGEFYFYPAQSIDKTRWQSADQTFHFAIAPGFFQRLAQNSQPFRSASVSLRPVPQQQDPTLAQLIQLIQAELNSPESAALERLYQESLSITLGLHLLRRYCDPAIGADTPGLSSAQQDRISDYIQVHLTDKLSLEAMAQQLGMSRSYFALQFKQSWGISPHQFVSQQRIERTKTLLRRDRRPIIDIALDCGFSSQSHFSKVFKRYVGLSPNAYRRAL